jgi:putative transcriptional regulator
MAIKVNLDLILVQRKVSLTDLSNKVGISITNLSILKLNKAKAIRFSTLDAICRELKCSPGDLLEHIEE